MIIGVSSTGKVVVVGIFGFTNGLVNFGVVVVGGGVTGIGDLGSTTTTYVVSFVSSSVVSVLVYVL